MPHGNVRLKDKTKRPYIRTFISVKREIEKERRVPPSTFFRNRFDNPNNYFIRQKVAVQNFLFIIRKKTLLLDGSNQSINRISRLVLFNLHEFPYDLSFTKSCNKHPNTIVSGRGACTNFQSVFFIENLSIMQLVYVFVNNKQDETE